MTITEDQIKEALQLSYAMNKPVSVEIVTIVKRLADRQEFDGRIIIEDVKTTLSFTLKNNVEWFETNPGDRENEPEGKWIGDFTLTEIEMFNNEGSVPVSEQEVAEAFRIAFESYYNLR